MFNKRSVLRRQSRDTNRNIKRKKCSVLRRQGRDSTVHRPFYISKYKMS